MKKFAYVNIIISVIVVVLLMGHVVRKQIRELWRNTSERVEFVKEIKSGDIPLSDTVSIEVVNQVEELKKKILENNTEVYVGIRSLKGNKRYIMVVIERKDGREVYFLEVDSNWRVKNIERGGEYILNRRFGSKIRRR